jgi:predicted  nucleic acid-binding Zn-ribbon protein
VGAEAAAALERAEKAESEVALLLARSESLQQQLRDSHAGMLKLQGAAADAQAAWDDKVTQLKAQVRTLPYADCTCDCLSCTRS